MEACWGPEFEPSVEEIVDYPMISLWRFSQLAFSSELAFRAGGFPYSVEHVAGEGQPAQAARPNIVCVYGAWSLSMCPSSNLWWRLREGLWTYSLSFSLRPESQLETKNSALAMMK